MAASRKCEHCLKVKRCLMYVDQNNRPVYLCRKDARELGYPVPREESPK